MHKALDTALETVDQSEAAEADKAKAMGLMVGYHKRWEHSDWISISTEEQFQVPIYNLKTGRQSRLFQHAGIYDGVMADQHGKLFIREQKTTAEDIASDASYWRRLAIDGQLSGYTWAKWLEGTRISGVVYDVIRKPGIRPKVIAKATAQQAIITGKYCGMAINQTESLESLAADRSETPELFMFRLIQEVTENPHKYFQRRVIQRLDQELIEYAQELWHTAHEIRDAQQYAIHCKNPSACMQYGRPCEYLGICSGYDSPDSDQWTESEQVHRELDLENTDGKELLTNSRIACFRDCHRKHHYRYDLGLRKVDREESPALLFGALIHSALDSYWSTLQEIQNESICNADPVNAIGTATADSAVPGC